MEINPEGHQKRQKIEGVDMPRLKLFKQIVSDDEQEQGKNMWPRKPMEDRRRDGQ